MTRTRVIRNPRPRCPAGLTALYSVSNPWPEEDRGRRCACGAELEFLTIVHQPIPDDRPERPTVH